MSETEGERKQVWAAIREMNIDRKLALLIQLQEYYNGPETRQFLGLTQVIHSVAAQGIAVRR